MSKSPMRIIQKRKLPGRKHLKKTKQKLNKTGVVLGVLAMSFLLGGCGTVEKYGKIENVNNLEGRRVGAWIGLGADYIMTGREDANVVRYSRMADMVMALCYQKVDAILVDEVYVPNILSAVSGVRRVEEPAAQDGLVCCVSSRRSDLLEEFNDFIVWFHNTEEYEDLLERVTDPDGYEYKEVPLTGDGETIRAGIAEDNDPYTYLDFETNEYKGIDVEVMRHFANYCGYTIEYSGGSWTSVSMAMNSGKIDIWLDGISNTYREDYTYFGKRLMSDIYMPVDMILIEVEDAEALKINAAL